MLNLDTKIEDLYSVGKTIAARLKRLDLKTAKDLLFYFPFRYEDFREITRIKNLKVNANANIAGQIELIQNKKSPRKRMYITEALISDESGKIKVIWFNQPFIVKNLRIGDKVSLSGKVTDDNFGLIMKAPIYEKISGFESVHTQGLMPNYHLTANLTQKQIRFLIKQIIKLAKKIPDSLPRETAKSQKLISLAKAIEYIHFPENYKEVEAARKRLGFEELFLLQLQSLLIKQKLDKAKAKKQKFKEKQIKKFVSSLPFKLTNAQRQAAWEIIQDTEKTRPMSRLLEGDVGSGKTIVAVIAMLNTALNGQQAVLMVPTEILACQHFETIKKLLKNFDIPIGLFTRSHKKNTLENNPQSPIPNPQIIIGTHALIQQKIKFENPGLVIIDEQHRFGVEQRKQLIENNKTSVLPHFLSMTATPIPRSLALALYGDLDLSIINELPKGRQKISTFVVPENKREDAYKFIRKQIKAGRQIFVICPLIDISDKLGVKSVKEEYKKLNERVFPELSIKMLHGRLKAKEKEKIMRDFLDNKINILVSTSVIEVGVDVPNATIIMIEGADRFGLSQLHQFRGRVGRAEHKSYCFLFTDSTAPNTIKRLQAMIRYNNGFELAEIDLKLRGPGEVYGTIQKGFPVLKVATIFDYEQIKKARSEAENLLKKDPQLEKSLNLKEKLSQAEIIN
ncbi:ATP-dependent DNA helicase RecG [Candidatus Parcubacteria bacterium]|nr:ATP-dependent DNA helicase RecG [Candidatus Parcubacteria bacterium]